VLTVRIVRLTRIRRQRIPHLGDVAGGLSA
jgi:hypothetical protein